MNTRSPQQIWLAALGSLQVQVNPANYTTWLKDTIGLSYDSGLFIVGVPHAFGMEWLQRRLHALVRRTLIDITGHDLEVEFRVISAPIVTSKTADMIIPTDPIPASSGPLNPRYTFDAFIVGDSNRMAYTACRDACENPGQGYNPLFIYGGPGLGKTHLLHAIGHTYRTKKMRGAYLSAERFTNEYIDAIQERQTKDFRQRYRDLDILLVDDLSFLCGKDKTEETFFHTFNELHNANRQIVVTCDCQPQALPLIKERLRSRLEWGLVVNIQPPEYETRLAILDARAHQICPDIPREVLDLICQQAGPSVRELEGCLNQVVATARVMKTPLTLDATFRIISGTEEVHPALPAITTEKILSLVAEHFELEEGVLTGRQRSSQVTQARQIAILILREETNQPLTEIGRLLGNRDHSTIIYSYKRALQEIEKDPQLRQIVLNIKQSLQKAD